MTNIRRYALAATVVLAFVGWTAYRVLLPAYVDTRVAAALAECGYPDAYFRVESVGPSRMVLREVELATGLSFDRVEVRYHLGGLLAGRADEMVLEGGRLRVSPNDVGNNPALQLVSGSREGGEGRPPIVHIVDSVITVEHETPVDIPIDADIIPHPESLAFEVRTRLAGLPVRIDGRHRKDAEQPIVATARLGDPDSTLDAEVGVRTLDDGRVALQVDARHEGALLTWDEHRVEAGVATLDGGVTLSGARIVDADLTARGQWVTVDGVTSEELIANLADRDEGVTGRLSGRGDWGRGWVEGRLDDDPRTWADAEVPLSWKLRGTVPATARRRLRRAGVAIPGRAELLTSGTATVAFDHDAGAVRIDDGRATIDLGDVELPERQVEARGVRATGRLSGRIGRGADLAELARTAQLHGRIEARLITLRQHPLFGATANLELDGDGIAVNGRIDSGDGVRGRLRGRLPLANPGAGHLQVEIRPSLVHSGDRVHAATRALTGIDLQGRISGSVRLDLAAPRRSQATVSLRDARIARDGHSVEGVVTDVELTRLEPLRLNISRSAFDLAGGRVRVDGFTVDPDHIDLPLMLELDGLSAGQVMSSVSRGRAAATGRLDGSLAVRVVWGDRPRVILGAGELRARARGRIRVRGSSSIDSMLADAAESEYGSAVRERVVAALDDFRYRHLSIRIGGPGARASVRLRGTGHAVRQDLDLTLNIGGLQTLADQTLRLWPRAMVRIGAHQPRKTR